jgi:MFS family permease
VVRSSSCGSRRLCSSGPALLDRIGVRGAAALAALAGIVRWSVAGVTTSVLILSILQPLHGLTFALLHLACMRIMAALVQPGLAVTAQALYAFASGLVTAALTLLSGMLYAAYGGEAFLWMAILCGIALPFGWFGFTNEHQTADEERWQFSGRRAPVSWNHKAIRCTRLMTPTSSSGP